MSSILISYITSLIKNHHVGKPVGIGQNVRFSGDFRCQTVDKDDRPSAILNIGDLVFLVSF